MIKNIIGREHEKNSLAKIWQSPRAEFLALYGRRRVGKTHLIRNFFSNKGIYIEVTGLKDGSMAQQINNCLKAIKPIFQNPPYWETPNNWLDVFDGLTVAIEALPKSKRAVLFLDELPWLATKRSGLMQALDYYWNTRWSKLKNFRLIVCGSAASWMLDQLIHAKGGLHNRLTQTILLQPYTLKETKKYLHAKGIKFSNKQIVDMYMVMGGVPHYLNQIEKSFSPAQNINHICFAKDGLLFSEFKSLFAALFEKSEISTAIVQAIADKPQGLSREQLLSALSLTSGGGVNRRINELEVSGFIQRYVPYGRLSRDVYFKIIDPYTLFYLKWIARLYKANRAIHDPNYWQKKMNTPAWYSWAGHAFENICLLHATQIAHALQLQNIGYETGSWRFIPPKGSHKQGAQIDLLFDRNDGIITLCEIKYSSTKYAIDKDYAKKLAQKITVFDENFKTHKQLTLAMITAAGLKKSIWTDELVHHEIDLSAFFE